jgi:hypothetical protein
MRVFHRLPHVGMASRYGAGLVDDRHWVAAVGGRRVGRFLAITVEATAIRLGRASRRRRGPCIRPRSTSASRSVATCPASAVVEDGYESVSASQRIPKRIREEATGIPPYHHSKDGPSMTVIRRSSITVIALTARGPDLGFTGRTP